jgi:hypothetical protein
MTMLKQTLLAIVGLIAFGLASASPVNAAEASPVKLPMAVTIGDQTYEQVESRSNVTQLELGKQVTLAPEKCDEPIKVDWLHKTVTCSEAVTLTATKGGLQQTGGAVTTETRKREEIVIGFLAMILMAGGMMAMAFSIRLQRKTGASNAFAFAAAYAAAVGVAYAAAAAAVAVAAFAAAFAAVFAADENKKPFYLAAWIFQGLMAVGLWVVV